MINIKEFKSKGRNCDNCGANLNDDDFDRSGSWNYECSKCGFRYNHNSSKSAEEQAAEFSNESKSITEALSDKVSYADDVEGLGSDFAKALSITPVSVVGKMTAFDGDITIIMSSGDKIRYTYHVPGHGGGSVPEQTVIINGKKINLRSNDLIEPTDLAKYWFEYIRR